MRADRKQTILFIIILLILSMGIGYAFLTTTLNIDGVSDIDSALWNIHWDEVEEDSTYKTQVISHASIGNNGTSVNYHIKLLEPGASYSFYVDAVNDGTLAAKIDDVIFKVNGVETTLPDYLSYEFTYDGSGDYMDVSVGDYLFSGESRKMYFRIDYRWWIDPDDLPSEDQSLNITIDVVYNQVSGGKYVYTTTTNNWDVGIYHDQQIPTNILTYNNYQTPMNELGQDFFIRLLLYENVPSRFSVGFVYNGNVYYLEGNDGGAAYEQNKALLTSLFGEENCTYVAYNMYYSCDDVSTDHYYRTQKGGEVVVGLISENLNCYVYHMDNKNYFNCGIFGG